MTKSHFARCFRALGLILILTLFTDLASGQSGTGCEGLMRFGIYDKFSNLSSESQFTELKKFLKDNEFKSRHDVESKAGALGLQYADILNLNLNGKSSSDNFEEWRKDFLTTTYAVAQRAGLQITSVEKISSEIRHIIETCLTQKGLHAYLMPSRDNQTFNLVVDFAPYGSQLLTRGTITVSPASVAATCSDPASLNKAINIGPNGIGLSFRRLPTETVTVNVNASEGTANITYDAYEVPVPSVTFSATDEEIESGASTTLKWDVANASQVELDGSGAVNFTASKTVAPNQTKEYRLIVTSMDGRKTSSFVTIRVRPPPPTLTGASIFFHTNDDDKDHDTRVDVALMLGGVTVASTGGVEGAWGHFDDHSDHAFTLNIVNHPKKAEIIGGSHLVVYISPNGHDTWKFNTVFTVTFSDGTSAPYPANGVVLSQSNRTLNLSL